jgi:hypothetical protein
MDKNEVKSDAKPKAPSGRSKYAPQELEFYRKVRAKLEGQGALPNSDPRKDLACMRFLMNNGVLASEMVDLIDRSLKDKWHRPRILDAGFVHLKFRLNELRTLPAQTDQSEPPPRKWETATAYDL